MKEDAGRVRGERSYCHKLSVYKERRISGERLLHLRSRWKEKDSGEDTSLTRFNSAAGDVRRRRR